jgi:hypothetical protein
VEWSLLGNLRAGSFALLGLLAQAGQIVNSLRCRTTSKTSQQALVPSVLSPQRDAVPMSGNDNPGTISSGFVFWGDCAITTSVLDMRMVALLEPHPIAGEADFAKLALWGNNCAVSPRGLLVGLCLGSVGAFLMTAYGNCFGPSRGRFKPAHDRASTLSGERGVIDACNGFKGLFGQCAARSKLQLECFVK